MQPMCTFQNIFADEHFTGNIPAFCNLLFIRRLDFYMTIHFRSKHISFFQAEQGIITYCYDNTIQDRFQIFSVYEKYLFKIILFDIAQKFVHFFKN